MAKRKAQTKLETVERKRIMMEVDNSEQAISPSSKIRIFKLDVINCNGQAISQSTELGAQDLENIWTQTLGRKIEELSGYTSTKTQKKEIRIQYQLKNPMSIRDIANEHEFTHERSSVFATDNFRCRVVGLGEVRQATKGETVKVTVNLPNFDITPEQVVEWMTKFGKVKEGHRYLISTSCYEGLVNPLS